MISANNFRIAIADQENKEAALTARKGVAKSTRKPLGERTINQTPLQKHIKVTPLKDCNINMQNVPKKENVQKPQAKNTYPEWYADVCSFKNIEDDYEDICSKSDRLDPKGILNFMLHPKTPPYYDNSKFFTPVLETPPKSIYDYYDDDDNILEIPITDVELPNFSL
ncbi:hypothetical protein RN001_011882 [Aquatica leii]|uniref:Securin n=1 Tax=Aquatica leii TaxID=1421715 RepID=A0AAN7SP98_9COLE|nr:hypothetical protein RN001_011882 [Aquatica leii]